VSRTQRLSFLAVAVVIAVVAVIVLTSGGDDEPDTTSATATATATAAPGETGTPTPEATRPPHRPAPPTLTPGKVTDLRFKENDIVRFRVRSDVADEVHVHGYDLMKDVEPGQTITFSFPATITGIFEIELENAGEQIAELRVDPD
jgi:heme/copper-type cytochrome/quinol oxidase subunit 2